MDIKKELKNKFKSLTFNKLKSDTSMNDDDDETFTIVEPYAIQTASPGSPTIAVDPQVDRDIIENIELNYFDGSFDSSRHELERLQVLDTNVIEGLQVNLQRQYEAVSKKVSDMILDKHLAYEKELDRVIQMQLSLEWAASVCSGSRNNLNETLKSFTGRTLEMLSSYRKKKVLQGLQRALKTIKTLQQTDVRLREMLDESDFSGAIQLCLECLKAASTFKHYKCISDLNSKLQDTLVLIEEQLDIALSKICYGFNKTHYEELQKSYILLDKSQMAMDQLHMHFASVIHNKAFQIVLGYVQLYAVDRNINYQRCHYNELCKFISEECTMECLVDLCRALWDVMKSYHNVSDWHNSQISSQQEDTVESNFNRRYTEQKLEHGRGRVWQDVQNKVKVFVSSASFSHFKYDDFIKALDTINRLMLIGEQFCGSGSEALQESIQSQTVNYFLNYHHQRMDELRLFFETEAWELCPVKSNFSCMHLQEFKFLQILNKENTMSSTEEELNFFEVFANDETPFDLKTNQADISEDVLLNNIDDELSSSSDDEDIQLEDDVSSPSKRVIDHVQNSKRSTILANTTLNVLRLVGKYMQMMSVLKPIAFDVIQCICQLFDYYLYCIYYFFATDCPPEMRDFLLSTRLRATLRRMDEQLIFHEDGSMIYSNDQSNMDRVSLPNVSVSLLVNDSRSLYGLLRRVVAVESLVELSNQYLLLQPYLDQAVPANKQAFLQQFFSQVVKVCPELRLAIYFPVVEKSLYFDGVTAQLQTVRWDVRELMSEHNSYIDEILRLTNEFATNLNSVSKAMPLPKMALTVIWQHCMTLTNEVMIEGFSSARKCTNEGRALMQLDFQQYLLKLEKISGIRSSQIHGRQIVENFIKAYYLPEDQIESWVNDYKKDYTNKQMVGLIHSLPHLSKRTRNRLLGIFDEGTPKLADKILQKI